MSRRIWTRGRNASRSTCRCSLSSLGTQTGAHVRRISFYTVELTAGLGMDETFRDTIHFASPMHDVGKIAIPDTILLKPSKFEPHEWEIMKTHAAVGAKLTALRGAHAGDL